jgi:hypothetical protein
MIVVYPSVQPTITDILTILIAMPALSGSSKAVAGFFWGLTIRNKNMKKTLISSVLTGLFYLAGFGTIAAQDDGMLVIPVELFACSYNEQKGPDDLDKVIDNWNAWADRQGIDDYAAWTLTPYYFGQEQEFDVIWVGAGKDAVALGKAQDSYLSKNEGLEDQFNEVISCDAHTNMASLNYKAPPKGATPANSIMTFSDCKYKEGATFAALSAAMGDWSQHLSDAGSKAGIWHWYPMYGGGGEEFSFKWIEAFKNFAELGVDYESFGNGGGYATSGRLFGHLLSCDSSRAYLAQSRRFVQLR